MQKAKPKAKAKAILAPCSNSCAVYYVAGTVYVQYHDLDLITVLIPGVPGQ
jgi:hypothetical protein